MAKPEITFRNTLGSALTFTQLDTNFQNLRDATISVSDGSDTITLDLNDTLNITAGANISFGINPTTKTLTITASEEQQIFQIIDTDSGTATADSTSDILTISGQTGISTSATGDTIGIDLDDTAVTPGTYEFATITVDQQGRITSANSVELVAGDSISLEQDSLGHLVISSTAQDLTSSDAILIGQPDFDRVVLGANNTADNKELQIQGRHDGAVGAVLLLKQDVTLSANLTNGDIDLLPASNRSILCNDRRLRDAKLSRYTEELHSIGNSGSGVITPDYNDGPVQTITATGNFQIDSIANMKTGASLTLIITQDGTGNRVCEFGDSANRFLFANNDDELSTVGGRIDVVSIFALETEYLASISRNFA